MMDHEEWRNAYLRATQEDIVTILRKEYEHFNNDGVGDYEVITTAADEIERLRAELIETRSEIQRLQSIARY